MENKEKLREEFLKDLTYETSGGPYMIHRGSKPDVVFDWFYSKIEEKDKQIEKLTTLLQAAESVMNNIHFEPTLNGRSVFSPMCGYKKFNEALEKYNSLKEQKG
jgi:hypothetical protein